MERGCELEEWTGSLQTIGEAEMPLLKATVVVVVLKNKVLAKRERALRKKVFSFVRYVHNGAYFSSEIQKEAELSILNISLLLVVQAAPASVDP